MAKLRPTPKGQVTAELELGGPFAKVASLVIPLPLTTVGASYGVADHVDISAHFHPTAAIFKIAGLDLGAAWQPLLQKGAVPAVTLVGRLYGFTNFTSGFQPYLELGATGSQQGPPPATRAATGADAEVATRQRQAGGFIELS